MAISDVHGPVDIVVLEFPAGTSGAATGAALRDLLERGTVRLYDLMLIAKGEDGSVTEVEFSGDGHLESFVEFSGARSGLLGDSDLAEAANVLEPGSFAAVLVYENAWAIPFVAAARGEGAQLVASVRLSAQDVVDALDALEHEG